MLRDLLVLPSGEELFSGKPGENAISGVKVTHCVNTEEELTAGAVCSAMLEVSVIAEKALDLCAGDEVTLYRVMADGQREKVGIFIARKPVWESANRYTLTAYDRASRLDKDLTNWLENLSGWPYAMKDFASMVCSQCGVELVDGELPNGDYPVEAFSGQGITGRVLMQWAGQAAGRFCRANPQGQMEFAWYEKAAKVIGPQEISISAGPAGTAVLEGLAEGMPIEASTKTNINFAGRKTVRLYQRGRNVLDVHSAGIYHSNGYSNIRHNLSVTDGGFRVDVTSGIKVVDKTLWGFCLGTVKALKGKCLTVSAEYSTNQTTDYAVPYMTFCSVTEDPVYETGDTFNGVQGGYLYSGAFKQLCYATGKDAKSLTYTATGDETGEYIAVLFCLGSPGRVALSTGDWVQWDKIQVEYASAPTQYQPYIFRSYERTFPALYQGVMNWNTGELTEYYGKIQSYNGEEVPEGWVSNTGSLTAGAQVLYPLAEPIVTRLEPQPITAIEGKNYLWSSTGNTSVAFYQGYYFSGSFSYEDYQTAPVEKVQIQLTDKDLGAVYPDDTGASNTYILSGNYLLTDETGEKNEAVAQCLYEMLKDITYTPCRLDVPAGMGIKAGDVVTVIRPDGKEMTVYVMSHTANGQRDILECTGSPRRNSSEITNKQSYKALSGKILELQMDVEGLYVANQEAAGNLSGLELTVEGIAAAVSQSQKTDENLVQEMTQLRQSAQGVSLLVQKLQEGGVSKVKTDIGYTFDNEGLKICRSDGEMANLLDNTGMYVMRGGDTVLQANSDGVQAMNIAVRNYLSVGNNARFEDYNDGSNSKRTACFFTGG